MASPRKTPGFDCCGLTVFIRKVKMKQMKEHLINILKNQILILTMLPYD